MRRRTRRHGFTTGEFYAWYFDEHKNRVLLDTEGRRHDLARVVTVTPIGQGGVLSEERGECMRDQRNLLHYGRHESPIVRTVLWTTVWRKISISIKPASGQPGSSVRMPTQDAQGRVHATTLLL